MNARESMLRTELLSRAAQEAEAGAVDVGAALRNLAERLGEFCDQGAYSYLLDRETNIPGDSPLVVFDTETLPRGDPRPGDALDRSSTSHGRSSATTPSTAISPASPACRGCAC